MNFCTFSFDSVNPKVVLTAAILMFNHVLCFKRDKSLLNAEIEKALTKISERISDASFIDPEGLSGLLVCECRLLYQNKHGVEFVKNKLEPSYRKNH